MCERSFNVIRWWCIWCFSGLGNLWGSLSPFLETERSMIIKKKLGWGHCWWCCMGIESKSWWVKIFAPLKVAQSSSSMNPCGHKSSVPNSIDPHIDASSIQHISSLSYGVAAHKHVKEANSLLFVAFGCLWTRAGASCEQVDIQWSYLGVH